MKVLALRADFGGCAKYRIEEPVKVLREKYGWDIRIDQDVNVDAEKHLGSKRYTIHEVKEDVDLIVIQRPLRHSVNAVMQQAQKQGIAVVVELDDDLENTHPKNAAYREVNPKYSDTSNWDWLRKTSDIADMVTVSTPALLHYAKHGRGVVIPNCIPDEVFDRVYTTGRGPSGVGWTGIVATHPGDLETAGNGIARALTKHKQDFHVVGEDIAVRQVLGLPYNVNVHATGWRPLDEYYQAIKETIKIGVIPLADNKFNHGKSHLKGIEMAALGIPFIASPTPEYLRLAEEGIGQIASTPDEWKSALDRLLTKPQKAYMLGQKYRSEVQKRYRYSLFAESWKDAWEAAVAYRKSQ